MVKTLERSVEPSDALNIIRRELINMGLEYELTTMGAPDSIQTYRCTLLDMSHKELAVGNGKGLGPQSEASAVFEALEHLFVAFPPQSGIQEIPIGDLLGRGEVLQDPALQIIKQWHPSTRLDCRVYQSLRDGTEVFYPLFLAAPGCGIPPVARSVLAPAAKYSTNNGTATGLGKTEALIHAISEVVERDSLSCFLLQTFVARHPKPVRVIGRHSLPLGLVNLMVDAEEIIGASIQLLDITTELQIPSILAVGGNGYGVSFVGSGASLSKSYAIERALLETVQSFHLSTAALREEDASFLRLFSKLPRYQSCIRLDLTHCPTVTVSYNDVVSYGLPENLENHLSQLIQRVEGCGYPIFFHHVHASELGVDCVHCIVPGLEKFHLVRSGQPVLPSSRGAAKIDELRLAK